MKSDEVGDKQKGDTAKVSPLSDMYIGMVILPTLSSTVHPRECSRILLYRATR